MSLEGFRSIPISTVKRAVSEFASKRESEDIIQLAFRTRAVEKTLLSFFGKGKLHGTIHTCVGQELAGVIVGAVLQLGDFVTSNHRGHGHFIGATKNWQGLVDEIIGNSQGVCGGVGGSQHLCAQGFLSNGQQGGLIPVAAGVALNRKRKGNGNISVGFIGEGTLGEGVVYETMNIASLWGLPLLIVCENNFYSQSTSQARSVAGELCDRASAFGLTTYRASTWFPDEFVGVINTAVCKLREGIGPAFIQVETYRLNPHSKGDDHRDVGELSDFSHRDPLNILLAEPKFRDWYDDILSETRAYAEDALSKPKLTIEEYERPLPRVSVAQKRSRSDISTQNEYFSKSINQFYSDFMETDENVIFLGEDIADPYGGAFKVTSGLGSKFPGRLITTPISEAAVVGVGIGLAISGSRPVVEIMFGDFMTYAADQLINNAAKMRLMYNHQLKCPIIIRTPMGGGRGYGPTHSQSLERHFLGVADTIALSLNTLIDVNIQLTALPHVIQPVIIFENKADYTKKTFKCPQQYAVQVVGGLFPTTLITPLIRDPTLTIVSYGGIARLIAENLLDIFVQTDFVVELVVPTAIFPLEIEPILVSARRTGRLATIEEGSSFAGLGAEVVAQIAQLSSTPIPSVTIGAKLLPIPSEPTLESLVLPSIESICATLIAFKAKAR